MRVNIELYVTVLSELRSLCNFKIFWTCIITGTDVNMFKLLSSS
jgi:hypothetical protein